MSNQTFNSYSTRAVENGKLVIKQFQVTSTSFELTTPTGLATITHIGGNASFKFILDGVAYCSYGEKVALEIATEYTNPKYISTEGLTFDHDVSKVFTCLYIHCYTSPRPMWVKVPADWKWLPEGWNVIETNNTNVKVGDIVLLADNSEVTITKSGWTLFTEKGHISSWDMRGFRSC